MATGSVDCSIREIFDPVSHKAFDVAQARKARKRTKTELFLERLATKSRIGIQPLDIPARPGTLLPAVMHVEHRIVDLRRTSIIKEVAGIQRRARRGECAVVRLGELVFFCANRDAWILDSNDGYARCLMCNGEALPHGIMETKREFAVDWNGDYTIEGDVFVWRERGSDQEVRMAGYPVDAFRR